MCYGTASRCCLCHARQTAAVKASGFQGGPADVGKTLYKTDTAVRGF